MLIVKPIGVIRNDVKIPVIKGWGKVISELVFDEVYTEALDGIDDYSHVLVIFWLHLAGNRYTPKQHVQGRKELPMVGLFAKRGPSRPNPIGISAVRLIGHVQNVVKVQGLDAIDGTPLLDLKPYTPAFDHIDNARIPEWARFIYEVEDYF